MVRTALLHVLIGLFLVFAAGCAGMRPLPVREPASVAEVKGKWSGLDPALSADEASAHLEAYGNYYLLQASDLYRNNYRASDATFAGGVVGMAGGLTKSPETSILGALLSGGGSVANDRYKFRVQAQNYEKAADAMFCLRRVLFSMDIANNLLAPRDQVLDLPLLNERIEEVRRKLRVNQAAVELSTPDLAKLQAALADLIKKKDEKTVQTQQSMGQVRTLALTAALVELDKSYYNAEFTKCVAAF